MINNKSLHGYRGMSSDRASQVKEAGHDRERQFTERLGLPPPIAGTDKNDAVLRNGESISLKGGTRLQYQSLSPTSDKLDIIDAGERMRACAILFRNCTCENKESLKLALQPIMRELKDYLRAKGNQANFVRQMLSLNKNGSYVDYLGIKELGEQVYHVFSMDDVVNVVASYTEVENSKARSYKQMDDQKVIFRGDKGNIMELEVRKPSLSTRGTSFLCLGEKNKMLDLLMEYVNHSKVSREDERIKVISYGSATSTLTL